ncbi:AtpZ/AtpI family protein [Kineococcus xinjiangensis]|nr:AtpZ/AtpI family protein [Kineococcus xinjiangensis]
MTSDWKPGDTSPEDAGRPRLEESVAWNVSANLLAGMLLGGGAGWGLDRWLGTSFLVGIGLILGIALTLYYVWLRYGTH